MMRRAPAVLLSGVLALAAGSRAWAASPEAPGTKELEFDLKTSGAPAEDSDTRVWGRLEWLYVHRVTGQLRNTHQHEGDSISLTKDLGSDRGQFRPFIELGVATELWGLPFAVTTSVFEWDTEGDEILERGHFYGTTVVPRGEYTQTRAHFLRTTLEASLGVWGYGRDEYAWRLDVAMGGGLLAAVWDVNLQSQDDLEGIAGDPRFYAGVEAHKKLCDWFTLHMRGVVGNPSGIVGGYRFAADLAFGDVSVRAEFELGTPTFGGGAVLIDWALTPHVSVGFVWREWFDQIVDGGAWFGRTNEGFIRMHHALVGASLEVTF